MVKNSVLSKYLLTPVLEPDGLMWSLFFFFKSQSCWVIACKRWFVLTVVLSSAVLQVWWPVCSSDLGHLISIHLFHHSRHSMEVKIKMFLLFLSVYQLFGLLLMFIKTWERFSKYLTVCPQVFTNVQTQAEIQYVLKKVLTLLCICLCMQNSFPDRNEQSWQWRRQRGYWLPS